MPIYMLQTNRMNRSWVLENEALQILQRSLVDKVNNLPHDKANTCPFRYVMVIDVSPFLCGYSLGAQDMNRYGMVLLKSVRREEQSTVHRFVSSTILFGMSTFGELGISNCSYLRGTPFINATEKSEVG